MLSFTIGSTIVHPFYYMFKFLVAKLQTTSIGTPELVSNAC